MRSSACPLTTVSLFCCLVASWAAQAQEFVQGTDDVLAIPSGSGIPGGGDAVDLLSGPAIGSALPAPSDALHFPDQFTLSNISGIAVFPGQNPSAEKSCLTAMAYMRPDIANETLHQNWITAKNGCGRFIKLSICYRGTADCFSIRVPPGQTKSAIIGYAPNGSEVHYQITLED